jgi:ABC-type multidrug transport system ATPase subunit
MSGSVAAPERTAAAGPHERETPARGEPAVDARDLVRRFGATVALDGVSLTVPAGEIHALLGPNGAGKTTLVRLLAGLMTPTSGSVRVLGREVERKAREARGLVGLVPSGDRTFYLRISGLENLAFFARLNGFRRRAAFARGQELLEHVGLGDAAGRPVGTYSHGMQKRLSVARALITDPAVLLVDEATHDLDPEGARRVRGLVANCAERGAAVLWATQRLDEIRAFADRVTLLAHGRARFEGTVPGLLEHSRPRQYVLQLRNGSLTGRPLAVRSQEALGGLGTVTLAGDGDSEHFHLELSRHTLLGSAFVALASARIDVVACREDRSDIEEAFVALTEDGKEPA